MDTTATSTPTEITRLAADHGLELDSSTIVINEMGLDFRVAIARTTDGAAWVLRIPRRPEVMERAEVEGKVLDLVGPRLTVAVPSWRIRADDLLAYPLLPGEPGLEVAPDGELTWRVDVSSAAFGESLADLLAELHGVGAADARATGVMVQDAAGVRETWRSDIDRVAAHFTIAPQLRERWDAWLAQDDLWPSRTVLTHGEIYPGHTLVDTDGRITGVLDWTTAAVGDPARDFMFHQATASPEAFDRTVERYVARGGAVTPHFAEHCAHMYSASPVAYGLFALTTGEEEHRAAAAAALDPAPED